MSKPPISIAMRLPPVTAAFEDITPRIAEEILLKNRHNRAMNEGIVRRYVADIRNGQWKPTGQGISIAFDGTLLDGQHRLEAVRRAGVTVPMLVTRNLPFDAQESIDRNAPRTYVHQAQLRGEKNAKEIAARVRVLQLLVLRTAVSLSQSQWDAIREAFREGIEWSIEMAPSRLKHVRLAPVAGAIAYAYVDPYKEKIAEIVEQVATSSGLVMGTMPHTLHAYVQAIPKGEIPSLITRKVLRALHAYITGENFGKLQDSQAGVAFFDALHNAEMLELRSLILGADVGFMRR